jgi:transcriptional regulator with XRE-family HTH domain
MATQKLDADVTISSICVRVGRRIAELRALRGWSQRMLADHADIEYAHLARLELGQREAGLLILQKIADALETPVWELLK